MSNETEVKKIPRTVKREELLNGVWRLTYKLTNRMESAGFGGRLLSSYSDVITGVPRHLFNEHGIMQPGYLIERQTTILDPTESHLKRHIVDWLIGHPEVGIEQNQVELGEKFMAKKISNPRIMLVNLDHEEIEDLEESDYIDKLIGRLSLDKGQQAIGLQSLRFVLSALNLQYIEMKYVTNKKIEKQKLRKRLKDYARASRKNTDSVVSILDNIAAAKFDYEIKEMLRMEILYISNGMYKYNANPIGTSVDSVVKYFTQSPDFYTEISTELYKKLKIESKED